eukprot:SAG22_NODE_4_length_44774_cov_362.122149_15_plen_63_part_00
MPEAEDCSARAGGRRVYTHNLGGTHGAPSQADDKIRGNHMMSPDFIWFHPGAVSVLTYGSND